MRLKSFTAPTMAEATELVRRELGEEAIIVSSQRASDGRGARVTAAVEDSSIDEAPFPDVEEPETRTPAETIRQALAYHGTPLRLSERLIATASGISGRTALDAFAGALDAGFAFAPLPEEGGGGPVMLIGPPGGGKTITTAKLVARARLAGHSVGIITTDTRRAGGIEQLEAFTRILELPLRTADTPEELRAVLSNDAARAAAYIDTAGTNPFSDAEMENLGEMVRASMAEPVLVLPAGGDAMESSDIAAAFATVGAKRILVTRLDMARRLGSILAAADAAHLIFCDVSVTPRVADGLSPINPKSLARLIMPYSSESGGAQTITEAAS